MFLGLDDLRVRRAFYAGLTMIVIITALYLKPIYTLIGGDIVVWIYDVTVIILALTGAILSFLLARSFDRGEVLWQIWGSLGIGLLLWSFGEMLWLYYELIYVGEELYPSVADLLWVLGYIPLFAALWLRYRSLRVTPESNRVILTGVIFLTIVILVGWFVFRPILQDTESSGAVKFVSILYPVGDLSIAFMALVIVLIFSGGELTWPWAIITVGFVTIAVADLFYTYADWQGLYAVGAESNLISALADIPYFAAYVIIAFGLYLQARLQNTL